MFKKISRQISRRAQGKLPVRCRVDLYIHSICSIPSTVSECRLAFSRGHAVTVTKSLKPRSGSIHFGETLTLATTLYRDVAGRTDEKEIDVSIQGIEFDAPDKWAFFGRVSIDISQYVSKGLGAQNKIGLHIPCHALGAVIHLEGHMSVVEHNDNRYLFETDEQVLFPTTKEHAGTMKTGTHQLALEADSTASPRMEVIHASSMSSEPLANPAVREDTLNLQLQQLESLERDLAQLTESLTSRTEDNEPITERSLLTERTGQLTNRSSVEEIAAQLKAAEQRMQELEEESWSHSSKKEAEERLARLNMQIEAAERLIAELEFQDCEQTYLDDATEASLPRLIARDELPTSSHESSPAQTDDSDELVRNKSFTDNTKPKWSHSTTVKKVPESLLLETANELKRAEQTIHRLRAELQAKEAELADKCSAVEWEQRVLQLEEEFAILNAQLHNEQKAKEKAVAEATFLLEGRCRELESHTVHLEERIRGDVDQAVALDEAERHIIELQAKLREFETNIEEMQFEQMLPEKKIAELEAQVRAAQSQIAELEEIETAHSTTMMKINVLTADLNKAEASAEELAAVASEAELELKTAKEHMRVLELELCSANERSERLEANLASFQHSNLEVHELGVQHDRLQYELQVAEQQAIDVKSKLNAALQRIANLEDELTNKESVILQAEQRSKELLAVLAATEQQMQDQTNVLATSSARIALLESEAESHQASLEYIAQLEAQLEASQGQISQLEAMRKALDEVTATHQQATADLVAKWTAAQDQIAELEEELHTSKKSGDDQLASLKTAVDQMKTVELLLAESQGQHEATASELASTKHLLADAQQRVQDLNTQLSAAQAIEAKLREADARAADLEAQLHLHQTQHQTLLQDTEELDALRTSLAASNRRVTELEDALKTAADVTQYTEGLESQLQAARNDLTAKEAAVRAAELKADGAGQKLRSLQESPALSREAELNFGDDDNGEMAAKVKLLQDQVTNLSSELKQVTWRSQLKTSSLERERDMLAERVKKLEDALRRVGGEKVMDEIKVEKDSPRPVVSNSFRSKIPGPKPLLNSSSIDAELAAKLAAITSRTSSQGGSPVGSPTNGSPGGTSEGADKPQVRHVVTSLNERLAALESKQLNTTSNRVFQFKNHQTRT